MKKKYIYKQQCYVHFLHDAGVVSQSGIAKTFQLFEKSFDNFFKNLLLIWWKIVILSLVYRSQFSKLISEKITPRTGIYILTWCILRVIGHYISPHIWPGIYQLKLKFSFTIPALTSKLGGPLTPADEEVVPEDYPRPI